MEVDVSQQMASLIKWDCCIVCQDTGESKEINPTLAGHEKFLQDLQQWKDASLVPNKMNQQQVEKILTFSASDLFKNKTIWHKVCRNKCDKLNLNRKRTSSANQVSVNPPLKANVENSCSHAED